MTNQKNIFKVGFCVAYDWEMLKKSVPRVYEYADTICFSIDKNRKSWSGTPYNFDENAFQAFILEIDADKKIQVYEDDFSLSDLSPIENDNRQRNLMAKQMGEGGWHIQIDSDEYFLDFKGFIEYLKEFNPNPKPTQKPINICCNWINLVKKISNGYLLAYDIPTKPPIATNKPEYIFARVSPHFNHLTGFHVIHDSWARDKDDFWQKINSWGHSQDFNKESFFAIWDALDEFNYHFIRNFHPIQGDAVKKIYYIEGQDIEQLIGNLISKHDLKIPKSTLLLKNSRILSKLFSILKIS